MILTGISMILRYLCCLSVRKPLPYHVAQANSKLAMKPKMILNSWSSCLLFLSTERTGVHDLAWVVRCWGWNPRFYVY